MPYVTVTGRVFCPVCYYNHDAVAQEVKANDYTIIVAYECPSCGTLWETKYSQGCTLTVTEIEDEEEEDEEEYVEPDEDSDVWYKEEDEESAPSNVAKLL